MRFDDWRKRNKTILLFAVLILLAGGTFGLGLFFGGSGQDAPPQSLAQLEQAAKTLDDGHDHGKDEIAYWTCSMHPQIKLPDPGKCPICFMDLIPVLKEDSGGGNAQSLRQISLSPSARALTRVSTTPVIRRKVSVGARMVGKIEPDERLLAYITAWMPGRLDKLYVNYTGETVKKGQPMAEIYSPELIAAQAELIEAQKAAARFKDSKNAVVRDSAVRTLASAREKLRLLGLSSGQISATLTRRAPADHVTLTAPVGGVVIRKDALEGSYVMTGARIYAIADLSRVWVMLEAYESDLPWISVGRTVRFEAEALPGKVFTGVVSFVDPVLSDKTRTVNVRLEADNADGALKPGMFVRAVQEAPAGGDQEALVIPASAPLITGKRAVVYVADPEKDGVYEGREIVLGPRAGDYYTVRNGLKEGELVVDKGAFQIDSAIQIQAKPSMMNPEGGMAAGGHDHGAAPEKDAGAAKSAPAIPAAFLAKLAPLADAYAKVAQAVEKGDMVAAKAAFSDFQALVRQVNTDALTGGAALMWKELSTLLDNDALIGAESADAVELRWHFKELARDFERLRQAFPFENMAQEALSPATDKAAVPEAFRDQLAGVLAAYLPLQAALAQDDFQGAKKAGAAVRDSLFKVNMGLLSGATHDAWMTYLSGLDEGATAIDKAADIEAAREGFAPLSKALADVIAAFGITHEGPLFELFCPMAFLGKGATWVSEDETVRNPYFGPAMGSCGETARKIKD